MTLCFRINVTHTFLAGGKVEPFIIKDGLDEDENAELTTIRTGSSTFQGKATAGVLAGGTPLRKSFIHDGQTWNPVAPLPTQRVSPVCSILEMDDGEVRTFHVFRASALQQF